MKRSHALAVLDELVQFLRAHANYAQADVLEGIRLRLSRPDVTKLSRDDDLSLYGGMGSLSDLYISKENHHAVEDEKAANAALDRLRLRLRAAIDG
jgi:hypothetical protein